MSESNLSSPATSSSNSPEVAELRALCAELQSQTHTLRVALLIVAAAVCGFFWLEVRRSGQSLTALRPQVAQVMEASKVQDPIANRFVGQLVEFGKTHPDFATVLKKYQIQSSPAPATTAAPASATPAK